jgi:glycosyltransferase involved in cell wall biosynthesis
MNESHKVLLTIITPSFNQGAYIEQTIRSVLEQKYSNIEHIIIDGGSTDNTISVLKRHPHIRWISERDNGQADALRKGMDIATGDIIGWINSDDYYENGIFEQVIQCFQDPETMWVIGNLTYFDNQTGETLPDKSPAVTIEKLLKDPDIVRQQATFFRKSFLERAGGWDHKYFMAMDFDLWVRLAKLSSPKMVNLNWAYFRKHAFQKTSPVNLKRQTKEIMSILQREHAPWKLVASIYLKKHLFLMKSYVKDSLIRIGVINSRYRYKSIRLKKQN